MENRQLSEYEDKVLNIIYALEESKISLGVFSFFTDVEILKKSDMPRDQLNEILSSLQSKKLIILINNEESEVISNANVKYLVRSRIGHILWCLQNSKVMKNFDNHDWNMNVVDLKYVKFDKLISKRNQDLQSITHQTYFQEDFDIRAEADLLKGIIERFRREYSISSFQLNAMNEILHQLSKRDKSVEPQGISIVASTGSGKSLAYQLPLIIWVVSKKINLIKKYHNVNLARQHGNCSAILLFPRIALSRDQYESFIRIIDIVNDLIDGWIGIDLEKKNYFKIKLRKDFGGTSYAEKITIFKESETDIIITNTDTLKRRLYDPLAHVLYRYGIDLVLYDEVHLYEGLQGSYVAGLNARLINLVKFGHHGNYKGRSPLFVGMSATIAQPEKHCQKLFSLKNKPTIINDDNDEKEKHSTEHHIILKPRQGRIPIGVAIDATSCLIHNRRDGLKQWHLNQGSDEDRPKSITFIDSLDGTGRFVSQLNELEWYNLETQIPVQWPVKRRYPVYHKPLQREETGKSICDDCMTGTDVQVANCPAYSEGNCWYFSRDNGDRSFWRQLQGGTYNLPRDNIRSKRVSGQEVSSHSNDSNRLFFREDVRMMPYNHRIDLNESIDNLVSTSVLEVGVDFKNISEIILYGNIKSPASYKQKAGRGAREGNVVDGLCVMSVIYSTPLSNFYYRHFDRLVRPYQSPIKLEVRNPDIVSSQCFATVFDFLAANGIEMYKVRETKEEEKESYRIKQEYSKAMELITQNSVKEYLEKFLTMLDYPKNEIIDLIETTLEHITRLFIQFNQIILMDDKEKTLIDWLSLAPRDANTQRIMEEKFKSEFEIVNNGRNQLIKTKLQLKSEIKNFKKLIDEKISEKDMHNLLTELEETLN